METFDDSFSLAPTPGPGMCTLGAIGAGVFGVGWLLLFAALSNRVSDLSVEMMRGACYAIGVGGMALWLTWIGLGGTRHGGLWPMIGGAGGPLSMLMLVLSWDSVESEMRGVYVCLALFAIGQLFARGVNNWVRGCAFLSLCFVTATAVMPYDTTLLLAVMALAGTGFTLAAQFAVMGHRGNRPALAKI